MGLELELRTTDTRNVTVWSKTKQVLEGRLPEDLKGRVKYHYDVYRDGSSQIQALSIKVDGKTWFCTNPKFYDELYNNTPDDIRYKPGTDNAIIKRTGYVTNSWGEAMKHIHDFLNVLSIEESLTNDNYFIRMLALLDARTGKRRVRKMAENLKDEPEWFQKWILLRLGKSV